MPNFPGAKRGDRLTADHINEWITASRRDNERRFDGLVAPKGTTPKDQAGKAFCINVGDVDIPAGGLVSLEGLVDETEAAVLNGPVFQVRLLEDATTSPVNGAVATALIPYSGAGTCFVSGTCLAQLTDDNASLALAAGLATLWEAETSGTRYALVRFGAGGAQTSWLRIVGGNLLGSSEVPSILYASSLTVSQLYDPTVDTSYPNGLGYGELLIGSVSQGMVLIRHSFAGEQVPMLSGRVVGIAGTTTLTVSGGDDDGETMTAYLPTWG